MNENVFKIDILLSCIAIIFLLLNWLRGVIAIMLIMLIFDDWFDKDIEEVS